MKIKENTDFLATKCMDPKVIKNPYTGEWLAVNCDKCEACLNAKAGLYTSRLIRESKANRYSFFFTLTYDNEHIPLAIPSEREIVSPDGEIFPLTFHHSNPDGQCVRYCHASDLLSYKVNIFPHVQPSKLGRAHDIHSVLGVDVTDFVAVCSRSDVQKFLKRLRINISREYKKFHPDAKPEEYPTIRYFIASEYGPQTFRPHYHGILFTDSDFIACYIESFLSKSWPYDSPDRHKISSFGASASRYVASYCNSFADLPPILLSRAFRPFILQSKGPVIGYKAETREKVRGRVYQSDFRETSYDYRSQEVTLSSYPKQVVDTFFHQLPHTTGLSVEDRVSLFSESNWKRFFRGDMSVFHVDFVVSLFRPSLGKVTFEQVQKKFAEGLPWLDCIKLCDRSLYNAILDGIIEMPLYCRFAGLPEDYLHYVKLLDRISLKYFSMMMKYFYECQNNYIRLNGKKDLVKLFYPVDMSSSLKREIFFKTMKHGYVPFVNSLVRESNKEQHAKFVRRSMLKKHNDSKYSTQSLYYF